MCWMNGRGEIRKVLLCRDDAKRNNIDVFGKLTIDRYFSIGQG